MDSHNSLADKLKALGVKVVCELTGEDVFLDCLPEPFRSQAFELIRRQATDIDAFVALTDYYAKHATGYFGLPAERVHRISMGIRTAEFAAATPPVEPFTLGYLARICPEKGLAELCAAFVRLRRDGRACRLRIAGYLGRGHRAYHEQAMELVRRAGLSSDVEHVGELSWQGKQEFLRSLHVLTVPAIRPEAKGLYALEAIAAGVPAALPDHGAFPEIVERTGGGLLHAPKDTDALARALTRLMDEPAFRRELAERGRAAVHASFTAERMAAEAWQLYERAVSPDTMPGGNVKGEDHAAS